VILSVLGHLQQALIQFAADVVLQPALGLQKGSCIRLLLPVDA